MSLYNSKKIRHGVPASTYLVDDHVHGASQSQHPGWEIILGPRQSKSSVRIELNGKSFGFTDGEILIYNGREAHDEFYSGANTKCEAFVIEEEFLQSLLGDHACIRDIAFETKIEHVHLISNARQTYFALRYGNLDQSAIDGLVSAFVLDLLEKTSHSAKSQFKQDGFESFHLIAKDMIEVIHQNLFEKSLNLEFLAIELGVTKFHLIRMMKKALGCTPHQYVRKLRLEHAIDQLKNSNRTVTEIAFNVGFENVTSLNIALKNMYHSSPTSIRKGRKGG